MKNEKIKSEMYVLEHRIGVMVIDGMEFISLTDLARYVDVDEPRFPIQNWMRNKDVISYLGLCESLNNLYFNRVEFDTVKNDAGITNLK